MKCLDIDPESIRTDKAPQSISHSKRPRFSIGESEYISRRGISFGEDIGYSQSQELRLASTRTSDHDHWSVERIDGLFLGCIEAIVGGFNWCTHR